MKFRWLNITYFYKLFWPVYKQFSNQLINTEILIILTNTHNIKNSSVNILHNEN